MNTIQNYGMTNYQIGFHAKGKNYKQTLLSLKKTFLVPKVEEKEIRVKNSPFIDDPLEDMSDLLPFFDRLKYRRKYKIIPAREYYAHYFKFHLGVDELEAKPSNLKLAMENFKAKLISLKKTFLVPKVEEKEIRVKNSPFIDDPLEDMSDLLPFFDRLKYRRKYKIIPAREYYTHYFKFHLGVDELEAKPSNLKLTIENFKTKLISMLGL